MRKRPQGEKGEAVRGLLDLARGRLRGGLKRITPEE